MQKGGHTRPGALPRSLRSTAPLPRTPGLCGVGVPVSDAARGRGRGGAGPDGRGPSVNTTRSIPRPTPRTPARPTASAGESVEASSRVAAYFPNLSARSQAE